MVAKVHEQGFGEFREAVKDKEGIVLLGCGGSIQEWINGIVGMWSENGITDSDNPQLYFSDFIKLKTTGGRTDLAMVFKKDAKINIGKIAMWRLQFGDCSWISDYLVNYAGQHGFTDERFFESADESGENYDD